MRCQRVLLAALVGAAASSARPARAQTNLTLDDARVVLDAAKAEVKSRKAPGAAIAVVDAGGHVVAVERIDGTFAAGGPVSIGKARTAALFQKRTNVFEQLINKGRTAMGALPEGIFTPLQGGVPIRVNGKVIGAVGVSGAASAQQDEEIAIAAATALEKKKRADVRFYDGDDVKRLFERGGKIFERADQNYKVHASHRDRGGLAEIHEETDIFYVLKGAATFVTGGEVVKPKVVGPGEIRGPSIRGGKSRKLDAGDVIIIPAGTPHWFKKTSKPFDYYVVKVR